MSEKSHHFKGKYRGLFRTELTDQTHTATFHEPVLTALHVYDCEPVGMRSVEHEKTGDYQFIPKINPKGKWGIGGIDLVVTTHEGKSHSEPLSNVIMKYQSERIGQFKSLRESAHIRTQDGMIIMEGEIYFTITIQDAPTVSMPVLESVPQNKENTVFSDTRVSPGQEENQIPDLITNTGPQNRTNNNTPKLGCLPTSRGCLGGGCLGKVGRLLRWFFIISIMTSLLGKLLQWTDTRGGGSVRDEDNVEIEDRRLDPLQDTMAPQPWNYYIDHKIDWKDFSNLDYHNQYSTQTHLAEQSLQQHSKWANANVTDEMLFWHDLYYDLYSNDKQKLDSLILYFQNEWLSKNLTLTQAAEMVVTFVQEIPYVLIHDGTCSEAQAMGGFISEYHSEGLPCKAGVVAGIQSPYEFIHDLEGDCDTRSLLTFALLEGLKIKSSVWVSAEYGHSIIGIAVPTNSMNYKSLNGTRYFATELTAKGFRVGMMAPEHTDMDNWNIVLYNN
jgi:hypothetical protein